MGIEDSNPAGNGKKRIEDPIGGASSTVVTCSICLEQISIGGDRSTANLQCGHQFHLDCVGSAFNYISAMQCPNCRQLENGNWLFSSDLRLSSANEYNEYIDDFTDESYHVNYSDMFCPYRNRFSSLAYYGDPNLVPRNSDHSSLPQRYGQADFVSQNPEISEYLSTPVYPHNFGPFPMQNIHQHQHQHQHPQPPPPFSLWNSSIPMLSVARPNPDSFPVDDIAYRHHSMGSLSQYVNQHFNGNETLGSSANMRAPARPDGSDVPDITPMQIHSLVTRLRDLSVSPQYTEDRQHENNGGSYTSNVQSISTHDQMEQSQQQAFPSSENSGFYNRNNSHNHNTELNMTGNNNGQYQWEGDLLAPFPLLPVEGDFPYWDRLPLVRTETPTPTPTPPPSDYGSNLFTSFWSHNYNGSNATTPSSNQPPTSHLHHLH